MFYKLSESGISCLPLAQFNWNMLMEYSFFERISLESQIEIEIRKDLSLIFAA